MRSLNLTMFVMLPVPALSEGAVQTFHCTITATCDGAGACAPPGDAAEPGITFRIEPVDVGPQGEGDYRISYSDLSAPMTNVTGLGPLLWSEGDGDRHAILFTGETSLLWQSFDPASARSVVSFLSCEVTQ